MKIKVEHESILLAKDADLFFSFFGEFIVEFEVEPFSWVTRHFKKSRMHLD